ncbi:MAG: PorV/PorQ family protein [Ignavibacteriaceae bacterium]
MKKIFKLISVFILLLAVNNVFAGGGKRTGTAGASELLIPVGPRGIAMGESNLVAATGIEALFWNPAGVSHMQNNADVLFSHMSYIADIGVEYGAVAANFEGFGAIAFSLKALSIGDIPVTTTSNPDGTGELFSPTMVTAGVSYSRMLTDAISVGLTANLVSERMGNVSASGIAFDFGVIYQNLADINGLHIGVVLKNLGTEMQFDGSGLYYEGQLNEGNRPPTLYKVDSAPFEMPFNFQLAAGYRPVIDEMNSLLFTGIYQNNNFSGDEYKLGGEYGYNNMFFVRAGYLLSPDVGESFGESNYIYGFTAGAGINYEVEGFGVKVDYAFRDTKFFDGNHVFALTLGF